VHAFTVHRLCVGGLRLSPQLADIVLRRAMILVARSTGVGVRGGPYAHPLAL
jgi:hypothetical protein